MKFTVLPLLIMLTLPSWKAAYALDTTETFTVGYLTEYEAYYNTTVPVGDVGHSLEILIGGGIYENLSYYFTAGSLLGGNVDEISGPLVGLTYTPVSGERFALDFMPAFSFDPEDRGGLNYTSFKNFTASIDVEMNFIPHKYFQPYTVIGFSVSHDQYSAEAIWSVPAAAGVLIQLKEKIQLLIQLSVNADKSENWKLTEISPAAGLNFKVTENMEILTEAGIELRTEAYFFLCGMIYAL
jgi:hypothetical protein